MTPVVTSLPRHCEAYLHLRRELLDPGRDVKIHTNISTRGAREQVGPRLPTEPSKSCVAFRQRCESFWRRFLGMEFGKATFEHVLNLRKNRHAQL